MGAPAARGQADVVSLSAPLTETLYALRAQNRLAAVTSVAVFPEQVNLDRKAGKFRDLGSFTKPDVALIESLRPSLVLSDTGFHHDLAARLRAKGLRVIHLEPRSLDEIFTGMERVGEAVGKKKEALKLTAGFRAERAVIEKKTAALPKVKVYMEINHEGPWTTGAESPVNDLIRAAGGENIFVDRKEGVFVTTNDEIVRRNPDIILSPIWVNAKVGGLDGIIPLAQIFARPGYAETTAVRNSRVMYYDSALLKHEGPRQILAIRKLAHLLHPDVFEDPPGTIPWELGRIRP